VKFNIPRESLYKKGVAKKMTTIFRVPDMHCAACVLRLEMLEDTLPGIQRIKGSYRNQQLEVAYNPAELSEQEIVIAVQHQGYTAIPIV
jgi:copper chaperone CopZ